MSGQGGTVTMFMNSLLERCFQKRQPLTPAQRHARITADLNALLRYPTADGRRWARQDCAALDKLEAEYPELVPKQPTEPE